jgi:hypothetical protein
MTPGEHRPQPVSGGGGKEELGQKSGHVAIKPTEEIASEVGLGGQVGTPAKLAFWLCSWRFAPAGRGRPSAAASFRRWGQGRIRAKNWPRRYRTHGGDRFGSWPRGLKRKPGRNGPFGFGPAPGALPRQGASIGRSRFPEVGARNN